jgi:hypothetical protein
MPSAKIDDRASIEGIYSRSAFEEDAARNAVGNAQVLFGVRVESSPDEHGSFQLARAKQHVGEQARAGGAAFLAPDHQVRYSGVVRNEGPGTQRGEGTGDDAAGEYAAFIGRIIDTARSAGLSEPVGRNDERLRGFRGG